MIKQIALYKTTIREQQFITRRRTIDRDADQAQVMQEILDNLKKLGEVGSGHLLIRVKDHLFQEVELSYRLDARGTK